MPRGGGGGNNGSSTSGAVAPFLSKTYAMVDDPSTDEIVSWSQNGNSFVVWNEPQFSNLLSNYFKTNYFSSFVRQLNTYGFRKVDTDRWEFANESFLKGQKHLLKSISRRKPSSASAHTQQQQTQDPITSTAASVEVSSHGIEEDVESLKNDKNVMVQELVSLRQQQQATDHQLQTVGQRVNLMEQRQQQMMSFLAKAMQSPGFLSSLLNQQSESNRRISVRNKKRRLPKQDEEGLVGKFGSPLPNGQIVNYHPLMNEAAKAMLREILKMNSSVRLDPSVSNTNGLLIGGVPSTSSFSDIGSSSSRVSGVTLSEMLPGPLKSNPGVQASGPQATNFEAGPLATNFESHPLATNFEAQPSPCLTPDLSAATPFPEIVVHNDEEGRVFSGVPTSMPENSIAEGSDIVFSGSKAADMDFMDIISGLEADTNSGGTDDFSTEHIILDESPKLPGINDIFWEQFLSAASPLRGNAEQNSPNDFEGFCEEEEPQIGAEIPWDRNNHMNHLTEQMGFLASESVVL